MKQVVPNILTASNLFCGMLALIMVWQNQLWMVVALLIAAGLFDFFDGFVARILSVSSPVGKELDSLADAVTFGVVPGFIMARLIAEAGDHAFPFEGMWQAGTNWLWMTGLLIGVYSVVRLARFNLDTRQSDTFFGLPTPSNTMFVLGLWILFSVHHDSALIQILNQPWILAGISLISSMMLLMNVRLLALKFQSFGMKGNEYRYLLVLGSVLSLIILGWSALCFIILYYLALSLINNLQETGRLSGIVA